MKPLATRIMDTIRPTTSSRISAEQSAAAVVEREIADLEQRRAATLLADDPTEALKLAEQISAARRRLDTHQDRLKALADQSRREKVDDRQQRKDATLAAYQRKFGARVNACERIDKALAELAAAVSVHAEVCNIPSPGWPDDCFPPAKQYEHYLTASNGATLHRLELIVDRIVNGRFSADWLAGDETLTKYERQTWDPYIEFDQNRPAAGPR